MITFSDSAMQVVGNIFVSNSRITSDFTLDQVPVSTYNALPAVQKFRHHGVDLLEYIYIYIYIYSTFVIQRLSLCTGNDKLLRHSNT